MTAVEIPSGREEAWRYAPLDELRRRLHAPPDPEPPGAGPSGADVDRLAGQLSALRIVLVDGVHAPERSSSGLPAGLWCGTRTNLSPAMRAELTTPATGAPDGFEALNRARSDDVVYLLVGDGIHANQPVHVVHVSTGRGVSHPRVVVDVGAGSHVQLIESYVGTGDSLTNASTTVRLAPRATLTACRVQDEAADAAHVGRLDIRLDQAASAEVFLLAHGASAARTSTAIALAGNGASCRVTGLVSPRPGSRHDSVVTVDHAASRCTSDLADRAVVPEGARTSSTAQVIVRPDTVGTVAQQRTDNLLLHHTAQADSRPWLEIFADDVRANHGSATGRLDEDAVFYLRSRGIPERAAREVLTGAFARTVLERLNPAPLRDHVSAWFHPGEAA